MPKDIEIGYYLEKLQHLPLIDVRTPAEFTKGHIPGAINIPLFSNDERADVGTVYKQQSKEAAIELGYKYVSPKLDVYIQESQKVSPERKAVVYCWRGGMRSHSFGGHLKENGFDEVFTIEKGYKAYRNLAVNNYTNGTLNVLGGYTGSGKTHVLHKMKENGHQVIDLEELANHKGSAFGSIGMGQQPTTEQFANNLYWEWRTLDFNKPIWIEDENMSIGQVKLPEVLFKRIRDSKLYFIDIDREERAKQLVEDYALDDNRQLAVAIQKISKRLGPQFTKAALDQLAQTNLYEVAIITLSYYDKYYKKGLNKRDPEKVRVIPLKNTNPEQNANTLTSFQHV